MSTPDIKQNPHPIKRYEITISIKGAPGPFDTVTGYMGFDVKNDDCVPLTPVSGARLVPQKSIPFALTRINDEVYRGSVYTDLLLDDDYFHLGVCHWSMTSVDTILTKNRIDFTHSIFLEKIISNQPAINYFTINSYKDPGSHGTDTGTVKTTYVAQHPSEFFSVSVSAKVGAQ